MPHQCPECARFLSNSLVDGLVTAPAACPKCEATLTAEMFGLAVAPPPAEEAPAKKATRRKVVKPPSAASVRPPDQPAVRPPDRSPAEVRPGADGERDVLAGWDDEPGGEVVDLDAWRGGSRGVDQQTVALVAAGAGALGVAVGAALSPSGRTRGAFLGALVAGIAGAVAAARLGRPTS